MLVMCMVRFVLLGVKVRPVFTNVVMYVSFCYYVCYMYVAMYMFVFKDMQSINQPQEKAT